MCVIGLFDGAIVIASLIAVFGVSVFAVLTSTRRTDVASEFFLAGRQTPWWIVAASLVASNIGTEHFVGQAGAAAYSGVVLSLYEWLACYLVLSLGWFFAPVYLCAQLKTVPQFLEQRFNVYCRVMYIGVLLILYVLSKIGTSVYAGVVLLEVLLGWSMWKSVPLIIVSTAVYTIGGGLKLLIFVAGGLAGSVTSLNLVGGIDGLFDKYDDVGLSEKTHMIRSLDDRDYPWLGMLMSIPVTGLAYWCIDQEMVQRVLAARDLGEVRVGTSLAGMLKFLPPFITVFPGMVARIMFEMCNKYPDDGRYADWCSADLDDSKNSDRAYPLLIVNNFPNGVKGLMIASFLAAMMSSISSIFNSASTVFTYDIYERLCSHSGALSPERLTFVGRVVVCVITGLTLCYLPVIQEMDRGLYVLGNSALSHFSPPISAMFVSGIFTKHASGQGATVGVIIGFVVGFARFILSNIFQHHCDSECKGHRQKLTFSNWFLCLNFNYFAGLLFFLTVSVILTVSWFYPVKDSGQILNHTFRWTYLRSDSAAGSNCTSSHYYERLADESGEVLPGGETPSGLNLRHTMAVIMTIGAIASVSTALVVFH